MLFDRRLDGVAHACRADRAGRDGFDHFTLTLVRSGHFAVDAGLGFFEIAPGEGLLLHMLRSSASRIVGGHIVTISLSRDRIGAIAGPMVNLHGRALGAGRMGLLADYAAALTTRLDTTALKSATDALMALAAVALGRGSLRD